MELRTPSRREALSAERLPPWRGYNQLVLYSTQPPYKGWLVRGEPHSGGFYVRGTRHFMRQYLRLKLLLNRQQAEQVLDAIKANALVPEVQARIQQFLAGEYND